MKMKKTALAFMAGLSLMAVSAACPALAADKLPFSDVPSTHTYYDDICWAVENGIVIGCNGKFYPDEKVTLVTSDRSIP